MLRSSGSPLGSIPWGRAVPRVARAPRVFSCLGVTQLNQLPVQWTLVERGLRSGGGKRLRTEAKVVKRFDEHALRAADGSDRLQPSLADPVVDGAARDAQEYGGLIDRDAASESGFKGVHRGSWCDGIHGHALFLPASCIGRTGASKLCRNARRINALICNDLNGQSAPDVRFRR